MKRRLLILAIVASAGIGCKAKPQPAAPPPPRPRAIQPMAVVDILQVAKGMGWDREYQKGMMVADRQFQLDLYRQLLKLSQQASAVRAQVAKDAHLNAAQTLDIQNARNIADLFALPISADQRQLLLTSSLQVNLGMAEARRDYRRQLRKREVEMMESYRKLIIPVAQRVAAKTGFRMILPLDNSIVYYDPATNVSQQVIDELIRARPSWEQS